MHSGATTQSLLSLDHNADALGLPVALPRHRNPYNCMTTHENALVEFSVIARALTENVVSARRVSTDGHDMRVIGSDHNERVVVIGQ